MEFTTAPFVWLLLCIAPTFLPGRCFLPRICQFTVVVDLLSMVEFVPDGPIRDRFICNCGD